MSDNNDYTKEYTEEGFYKKLQQYARQLGQEVVEKLMILIYSLQDENVPLWAKSVIVGALGYFISPIDLYPDFMPGGFADDLVVILSALGSIAAFVSAETIARAKDRVAFWFN